MSKFYFLFCQKRKFSVIKRAGSLTNQKKLLVVAKKSSEKWVVVTIFNLQDISKPSQMEWSSPLEALEAVLELEKTVNGSLLAIHKEAEDRHDAHLEDYLESEFLEDQVGEIKKNARKKEKKYQLSQVSS